MGHVGKIAAHVVLAFLALILAGRYGRHRHAVHAGHPAPGRLFALGR
jgi:hypothetical protein